jgi:hypothetical protein
MNGLVSSLKLEITQEADLSSDVQQHSQLTQRTTSDQQESSELLLRTSRRALGDVDWDRNGGATNLRNEPKPLRGGKQVRVLVDIHDE